MKHFVTLPYLLSMYSTSSGRGFLPLVTAVHEISPTCSCMRNPGEEECMIHIRGANPHQAASGKRQTSKVPLAAWVDASIDFVLAADADAWCGQTLRLRRNIILDC